MTISFENINVLKVARYKCQQSLLFFTRYLFKGLHNRRFTIVDYQQEICNTLEKVLSGEITRLIINCPPRYAKTELAVKNFIAHGLSLNPSAKFIHLSYSDSLALDNSEEVKDMVMSDRYQQLFPEVTIKKDSKSKKKWYTTAGGGVYATAAGGQVTGFGAGQVDEEYCDDDEDSEMEEMFVRSKEKFGGAIIIDDPMKPDDADSDVIRERINQRFESTIRSRANSRNTPIIVIMQRLHPRDLCGHLLESEPGVWTVISFPAIKENGEALWPSKHSLEDLLHLKKINDIVFGRQYMQDPKLKEGLLFPREELNFYNPATVNLEELAEFRYCYIDPADEGGDALAAPVGYLAGNKIYIPELIYNKEGTDINQPAAISMILRNKCNSASIEGNSAWILFGKAVRNKVNEKNPNCEVRIIKNSSNKVTRIRERASFIRNNFVFREDYQSIPEYLKFMDNLCGYYRIQEGTTKNAHDDAPDSCAGMAYYFEKNFEHLY